MVSRAARYERGQKLGSTGLFLGAQSLWGQRHGDPKVSPGKLPVHDLHVSAVGGDKFQNNAPGVDTDDYVYDVGLYWNVTPALALDSSYYYVYDNAHKPNQSSVVSVGAEYSLSVRTTLYAQVAYVENRGTMGTGISANSPGQIAGLPEGGTTGVNLGIRHYF